MRQLQDAISDQAVKVAILGLGQVGLFQAVEMVKAGYHVCGIDSDHNRIHALRQRRSYVTDVSTDDVKDVMASGRFVLRDNLSELAQYDVIVVSMPTPVVDGKPDLVALQNASIAVVAQVRANQLIVVRSTIFPGTTEKYFGDLIQENGLTLGSEVAVVAAPERCNVGNRIYLDAKLPRVIGGITSECTRIAELFYKPLGAKIVPVSVRVAELSKLLENVFRFVNISLANELASICDSLNIDAYEVVRTAATKPFGFMPFTPGTGVGGMAMVAPPCYWLDGSVQLGLASPVVCGAIKTNLDAPNRLIKHVMKVLRAESITPNTASILLIGITYKPNIADARESTALSILGQLQQLGINVRYHDPYVPKITINSQVLHSCACNEDNLSKADFVVLLVNHSRLNLDLIKKCSLRLVDGCNATGSV